MVSGATAGVTGFLTATVQNSVTTIRITKMRSTTKENIMSDESNLQFRVNFFTLNGEFLLSSEWTTRRDVVIHISDTTNSRGGLSARPETKASGYADVGNGIKSH